MSRSGYNDDSENVAMWRGMVASATRGRRGQQFFKALLSALDAMPEKRLIAEQLEDGPGGEVCAIGALGKAKGVDMRNMDPEDAGPVAATFNIAECLAQEVVYMNDEYERYHYREIAGSRRHERIEETPEQRWVRMRAWVAKQIRDEQHGAPQK